MLTCCKLPYNGGKLCDVTAQVYHGKPALEYTRMAILHLLVEKHALCNAGPVTDATR